MTCITAIVQFTYNPCYLARISASLAELPVLLATFIGSNVVVVVVFVFDVDMHSSERERIYLPNFFSMSRNT